MATIRGGRVVFLECTLPPGDAAEDFLQRFLDDPKIWSDYAGRQRVAVPYAKLNAKTQRATLEALFPADYVDDAGWWHTVRFDGEEGVETLWALAEWLTGRGTNYRAILADERNRGITERLELGERVLVPARLLPEIMRHLTPRPAPPAPPTPPEEPTEPAPTTPPPAPPQAEPEAAEPEAPAPPPEKDTSPPPAETASLKAPPGVPLTYGSDSGGPYAIYRIKKGEALFSAVVLRFTDYRATSNVLEASQRIMVRSGVADARDIDAGKALLIPLDMLSDRYHPVGTEARQAVEAVEREAAQLAAEPVVKKDLDGVVLILDSGHGGVDPGSEYEREGLHEDEIAYDIACRVKRILERDTGVRIVMTIEDPSQGFRTSENKQFTYDTDERVLTTPPYTIQDTYTGVHLRWALANHEYERLRKEGVGEKDVLFLSIHCDALHKSLRGAMVYVPGARYCTVKDEMLSRSVFRKYAESKNRKTTVPSLSERRRSEALSRNFAATLLNSFSTHDPQLAIHRDSDPIRNVIHNHRTYVPAVLRYNHIPTKVLLEVANLMHPRDRTHLGNPEWREWCAEAVATAIRKHYGSGG